MLPQVAPALTPPSQARGLQRPSVGASKEHQMLQYSVVFFVIALIAAVFGFSGIASGAVGIAKILFILFAVLAVVSVLLSALRV